jgi:hypothetical protein
VLRGKKKKKKSHGSPLPAMPSPALSFKKKKTSTIFNVVEESWNENYKLRIPDYLLLILLRRTLIFCS